MSVNNIKNKKMRSVKSWVKSRNHKFCYMRAELKWKYINDEKREGWKTLFGKGHSPKLQNGNTFKSNEASTYEVNNTKLYKWNKKDNPRLFNYLYKFDRGDTKDNDMDLCYLSYKTSWDAPVLDIDNEENFNELLKDNPSLKERLDKLTTYLSRGKRLKHYTDWIITDKNNIRGSRRRIGLINQNGKEYGDLLVGGNDSWVRVGERLLTEVKEGDFDITIDLSELHFDNKPPTTKKNKKTKNSKKIKKDNKKKEEPVEDDDESSFEFSDLKRGDAGYKPFYKEYEVEYDRLNDLLDCIALKRWHKFSHWFKIGLILKGIEYDYNGGYALNLFFNHSQRSNNRGTFKEIKDKWDGFDIIKYQDSSIKTLHYWAKKDCPYKYNSYCIKYHIKQIKIHNKVEYWNSKKIATLLKQCSPDKGGIHKANVVDYLNQHFCLIQGKELRYVGINIYKSEDGSGEFMTYKNEAQFIKNWSKFTIPIRKNDRIINEPILKWWIQQPRSRIYIAAEFNPTLDKQPEYEYMGDQKINLFNGWRHSFNPKHKVNKQKIKKIIKHAREIIFNHDEEAFIFFHKCLRMILRGGKPEVAFFFWSKEYGTGKDWWIEFIVNGLMGEQYMGREDSIKNLVTGFNGIIKNKIVMVLDELNMFEGGNSLFGKYKSFITKKTIGLEEKGIDKIMVKCMVNIMGTSQYPNPIYIRDIQDRRSCVVAVNPKYKSSAEGSEEYHDQMTRLCGINKFQTSYEMEQQIPIQNEYFHYILLDPLFDYNNGWNPSQNIPLTTSKFNIVKRYTPKAILFYTNYIKYQQRSNNFGKVSSSDLWRAFKDFCSNYEIMYSYTSCKDFSIDLNKHISDDENQFKSRMSGSGYGFEVPEGCIDLLINKLKTKFCFDIYEDYEPVDKDDDDYYY